MAENKPRVVLQFNEYDFRHRKVLEILRARKRHMSDMVVSAVLHYISCPEAEAEFSKESVRKAVKDVITEMIADGSLEEILKIHNPAAPEGCIDPSEFGDIMAAFRK